MEIRLKQCPLGKRKVDVSGDQGVKWTSAYQIEQPELVVGEDEKSESDTSFNPNNLQIMTGLSGSQGEGIS